MNKIIAYRYTCVKAISGDRYFCLLAPTRATGFRKRDWMKGTGGTFYRTTALQSAPLPLYSQRFYIQLDA